MTHSGDGLAFDKEHTVLKKTLSVGTLLLGLTACATQPVTPSATGNTEHPYDGWWTARLLETPAMQFAGEWEISCSGLTGEFAIEVVDSRVYVSLLGRELEQPLDRRGRFDLRQATDYAFKESQSSDVALRDGGVTMVLKGDLRAHKHKGSLMQYVAEIGGGCKTPMSNSMSRASMGTACRRATPR